MIEALGQSIKHKKFLKLLSMINEEPIVVCPSKLDPEDGEEYHFKSNGILISLNKSSKVESITLFFKENVNFKMFTPDESFEFSNDLTKENIKRLIGNPDKKCRVPGKISYGFKINDWISYKLNGYWLRLEFDEKLIKVGYMTSEAVPSLKKTNNYVGI